MKTMPLGRRVKKLLMQNLNWTEISKICGKPEIICRDAYASFMGLKINNPKLHELINSKAKIHVYGESGSGKTYTVINLLKRMKIKNVIVSTPRSESDLVHDFEDLPFQEGLDIAFVIEGDNFYWKKYGLVKKILKESPYCVIIITIGKDDPTKWITSLVKQVKIQNPTQSDVLKYIKSVDPDWSGNILEIYDRDWRVVMRRLDYGFLHDDTLDKTQWIDSKVLAFKIIKGNAKIEDFDRCVHPVSFVINWIGYNAKNFWVGKSLIKNLDTISWCDANKYKLKEIYIKNALLDLIPSLQKGFMAFPPYKKKKEEKKEEEKIIIRKVKLDVKKKEKKQKKNDDEEYKGIQSELGSFLML